MLPGVEIMDIAEYAVPWQWQDTMRLHGCKSVMHTDSSNFVEFCKIHGGIRPPAKTVIKFKFDGSGKKLGKCPMAFRKQLGLPLH